MSLINVPDKIDNEIFFLPLYSSSDIYINFTDEEMSIIIYNLLNNLNLIYVDNIDLQKDILDFLVICNFNYILNYFNIKFDNELLIDFKEKILLETSTEISTNRPVHQLLIEGGVKSIHVNKKQMGGAKDPNLYIEQVKMIDIVSIKELLKALNQLYVIKFEKANNDKKLNEAEANIKYAIYTKLDLNDDEIQIFNKVNNILLILKYNYDTPGDENSHEYISFYEYICCNVLKISLPDDINTIFLDNPHKDNDVFLLRKHENDNKINTLKSLMEMRTNILTNYIQNSELIKFDWELTNLYDYIKLKNRDKSENSIIHDFEEKCLQLLILNLMHGINEEILDMIKNLFYQTHILTNQELNHKYPKKTILDYEKIFINLSKILAGHKFNNSEVFNSLLPNDVKAALFPWMAMMHNFANARELHKLTIVGKALGVGEGLVEKGAISYRDLLLQKKFIKIIKEDSFFFLFDKPPKIEIDDYQKNFEINKSFLLSKLNIAHELEYGVMAYDFDDTTSKPHYIKYMIDIRNYRDKIIKCFSFCKNIFTILSNKDCRVQLFLEEKAEELGVSDFLPSQQKDMAKLLTLFDLSGTDFIDYFKQGILTNTQELLKLEFNRKKIKAIQSVIDDSRTSLLQIESSTSKGAGLLKRKHNNKLRKHISKKKKHKLRTSKKLF